MTTSRQHPPEVKATKKFLEGINTLTFDHRVIGLTLALAPLVIQKRLMLVFRHWLDLLEGAYDRGQYESEEMMDLQVQAKRVNDAMRLYE